MMRNPWGTGFYTGPWNKDDANWNTIMKQQVPWGVDPTTAQTADGIFFMPLESFAGKACAVSFEIAHLRDDDGYKGVWYDADNVDEQIHSYYVTVPANDGALYFSVNGYYNDMIPNEC